VSSCEGRMGKCRAATPLEHRATTLSVDVIAGLLRSARAGDLVEIHRRTGSIGATLPQLFYHGPSPAASLPLLAGLSAVGLRTQGSTCYRVSFFPIKDLVFISLPFRRPALLTLPRTRLPLRLTRLQL